MPAAVARKVEAAELKQVKYPADSNWTGDWKEGEKIAQNGRGMQFTDAVGGVNGGNCCACHQLTKARDLLRQYRSVAVPVRQALRGNPPEVVKYTWGKIWDSNAYSACSNMPRFGHTGHPDRATDPRRDGAAAGPGVAGQPVTPARLRA